MTNINKTETTTTKRVDGCVVTMETTQQAYFGDATKYLPNVRSITIQPFDEGVVDISDYEFENSIGIGDGIYDFIMCNIEGEYNEQDKIASKIVVTLIDAEGEEVKSGTISHFSISLENQARYIILD